MRKKLKLWRVNKDNITQEEAAALIGCSRQTYSAIEAGDRAGTMKFWNGVQKAFDVPDAEMWEVMRNEEEGRK